MRLTAALMLWFALGGQTYPPPYPRSGTKALIDNARAQVWDVSWPKGQPSALHRHLYDMTGLYYWPGDRIITAVDGSTRNISTKAGQIQWQLKGITHIEEGTSADPLRWNRSPTLKPKSSEPVQAKNIGCAGYCNEVRCLSSFW